jgi:hypothetical protein
MRTKNEWAVKETPPLVSSMVVPGNLGGLTD